MGDAALIEASVRVLAELWPDAQLRASTRYRDNDAWLRELGADPAEPAVAFPAPGEGSGVRRAATFAASAAYRVGRSRLRPGEPRGKSENWPSVALSAAGGYLYSPRARTLSYSHYLAQIEVMSRRAPTVVLQQSIGPFTRARDATRLARALAAVEHVLVREPLSLRTAVDEVGLPPSKVTHVPDMVFALAQPMSRTQREGAPRAAMTVLDWRWAGGDGDEYERYLGRMAAAGQALIDGGWELDLCVQVELPGLEGHDDAPETQALHRRLRTPERARVVSSARSATEAFSLYRSYDAMIGSRLHSSLMSLCGGVPAVAVGYQPKAQGIYESIGLGDWVLDARELDQARLVELVSGFGRDPGPARQRVAEAVRAAREAVYGGIAEHLAPWLGPPAERQVWSSSS